jgi:hypothetical protein
VRRVLHIGGMAALLSVVGPAAGCDREMEEELCPELGVGGVVVTEIRGEQTVKRTMDDPPQPIPDPYGEWIELYNASGGSLDLYGLQLRFTELDGSNTGTVIVRRSLTVAAGERVVLSYHADDQRPAHADYGWYPDFPGSAAGEGHSLFPTGVIDVYACGERIDRVRPDGLNGNGTWSFPTDPPDAAANDDALLWCDDSTGATDAEYAAGTPGESNRVCP